jgi:hypothetical protein
VHRQLTATPGCGAAWAFACASCCW